MSLRVFEAAGDAVAMLWSLAGTEPVTGTSTQPAPQHAAASVHPVHLVVGGTRAARLLRVAHLIERHASRGQCPVVLEEDPSAWPFRRDPLATVPRRALVVVLGVAHAFPAHQINGTRLVLTNSLFALPLWLERLRALDTTGLLMEADGPQMRRAAPEAFDSRGAWAECTLVSLEGSFGSNDVSPPALSAQEAARGLGSRANPDVAERLGRAFGECAALARLERCRAIADEHPEHVIAQVALASACMEQNALEAAQASLDRAAALDPECGAVDYEQGKLYLRTERLDLAVEAFERASERLPHFASALVNLGAALGEIDRPHDALAAFRAARALDPRSIQVVNNIGVTARDLGDLTEAEAAFRQVTEMSPEFVFGHYNLGHTLFLRGEFAAAVQAYEAGQSRDAQRNVVQAARLGFCRLAAGDTTTGLADIEAALNVLSAERRAQLIEEGRQIEGALRSLLPTLDGLQDLRRLLAQAEDSARDE